MAYLDRDIPLNGAADLGLADRDIPLDPPDSLPGRLNTVMRTLIRTGYVPVLTIAFPDGNFQVAPVGYSSLSRGHFYAKLKASPSTDENLGDRGGDISPNEVSFSIIDTDRTLAAKFEGVYAESIVGSVMTYQLAHPLALPAQWVPLFTGLLEKADFSEPMVAELSGRTDDLALTSQFPKPGWFITPPVWPNAAANDLWKPAPVVYGMQNSQNFGGGGMVTGLYVDTVAFVYVVAAGRVGVSRVYSAGTAVAAANYSVVYLTRGGRLWTCVQFTSDQGNNTVTVDAQGYDLNDPLGGNTGTDMILQAWHLATNFIFGDSDGTRWLTPTTRINAVAATAVATRLARAGFRGGNLFDTTTDGYAVLGDLLTTAWFMAAWTPIGDINFIFEDPCSLVMYPPGSTLVARQEGGWSYRRSTEGIVTALLAHFNKARGDEKNGLEVLDPKTYTQASDEASMPWLANE